MPEKTIAMSLSDFFADAKDIFIPAGQTVLRQGEECQNYFLLKQGSIKVFSRSANGREVILYHVLAGHICVLTTTCLLGGKRYPAEAFAETDLIMRTMSKKYFDQLLDENREFRQALFHSFGNRIGSLIGTIEKLALESIDVRLAKFLLQQPQHTVVITHQELASELGSAREVISRHLKRLEDKQIIKLERGTITLLDRQSLHQLIQYS